MSAAYPFQLQDHSEMDHLPDPAKSATIPVSRWHYLYPTYKKSQMIWKCQTFHRVLGCVCPTAPATNDCVNGTSCRITYVNLYHPHSVAAVLTVQNTPGASDTRTGTGKMSALILPTARPFRNGPPPRPCQISQPSQCPDGTTCTPLPEKPDDLEMPELPHGVQIQMLDQVNVLHNQGMCLPNCASDNDCVNRTSCRDNVCKPLPPTSCTNSTDCPENTNCIKIPGQEQGKMSASYPSNSKTIQEMGPGPRNGQGPRPGNVSDFIINPISSCFVNILNSLFHCSRVKVITTE